MKEGGSMYELTKIGPQSYYISSPAKIGVYVPDPERVYFIDSGSDKDAGRKARQILEKNGWKLRGILVTHSNADHIGGCRYLRQQTGCRVFAPGIERAFTENPILEPSFLYGGYPPADLRHKFLLAQDCECSDVTDTDFPAEVEVIPLPGHFFHMAGFRLPDGTFFAADCVSSAETLEKYQIGFIYDVAAYLETLDRVSAMEANVFVPAHAEVCGSMRELADINRAKVLEIADRIADICRTPLNFEAILQRLFRDYGLTMDFAQYVLVGSTVRSYLSWLRDSGRLDAEFSDGMLLWKKAEKADV
jgi:glyoxylase-like metal-dependent hydrolase (beta-lactamase superfamily II)